jgi:ribosomal protein L11 methyltransferase
MLALFPQGFEEVDHDGTLELAAYTDADGELRMRSAFADSRADEVASGWEERWREFHHAAVVGPLWIGPPWEATPPPLTRVAIDPGRAFGTGAHATTRLCLSFLVDLQRGSLLDVGCGSGVLAIAAARLGYAPVVAVDSDAAAVEATARNAHLNRVSIAVGGADALVDTLPGADVAVANIALPVVAVLARRLRSSRLVASGYLRSDRLRVPGFRHVERRADGEWAADLYERA